MKIFIFNEAETRSKWFQEVLKEKGISFQIASAERLIGSSLDVFLPEIEGMFPDGAIFVDGTTQLKEVVASSEKYQTLVWKDAEELLTAANLELPEKTCDLIKMVGKTLPFNEMGKVFSTEELQGYFEFNGNF